MSEHDRKRQELLRKVSKGLLGSTVPLLMVAASGMAGNALANEPGFQAPSAIHGEYQAVAEGKAEGEAEGYGKAKGEGEGEGHRKAKGEGEGEGEGKGEGEGEGEGRRS